MPRTKRPVARKEKVIADGDDSLKKLDKFLAEFKKKIDNNVSLQTRHIELAFKILTSSIKPIYLHKTIGELKTELALKETHVPSGRATRNSTRSASHDDGYLTEGSTQDSLERKKRQIPVPMSKSRLTVSRSRSAEASARKPAPKTACKSVQRRRSKSIQYRTPAYNKNAPCIYPAITPKVTPQSALTVLRQPRQGEMVLSMSGSPVMVPNCYSLKAEQKANCNILLEDGTMLSLLPHELRQSQDYIPISLMGGGVFEQLKTLTDNLAKVVRLGEQARKGADGDSVL